MNIKLAVVEDNNTMRNMLVSYLSRYYEVADFKNGLEFFESLEQSLLPSLIVSDIQMPEMGGLELITLLKKSKIYSQVPVIILSGVNNSEAHAQCLEAGAEDYLVKPFNPKELLLKIQKILQNTSTNETLKNTSLS